MIWDGMQVARKHPKDAEMTGDVSCDQCAGPGSRRPAQFPEISGKSVRFLT